MSGGVPFDPAKFVALAAYVCQRGGYRGGPVDSDRLSVAMFLIDFEAYRKFGRSITGATYVKGDRVPWVREVGPDWFRRFVWARTPWWARVAGRAVALGALAAAIVDHAASRSAS